MDARRRAPAAGSADLRHRRRRVAMLAGALVLAAAHAGSPPRRAVELAPIRVVPSPLPGAAVDAWTLPYVVQRVAAEDIDAAQTANLPAYLSGDLVGVNANTVQGSPYQVDVTYHGFRASPTLGAAQGLSVYLDGVRVNEPFGDIVSWDMLPEQAIASLTLIPFANPLFGPNTLGGALALDTQSGLTDPGVHADLSWGRYARRRASVRYGAANADGWHAYVSGSHFDEDGWRRASNGRLGNLFARFGRHRTDDDWDLSVLHAASHLLGNGLLPSARLANGGDGADAGDAPGLYEADRRAVYTAPDRTRNRVTQFAVHASHAFDADTLLSTLAYTRHSARDTVNGDIGEDYEGYVEDCADGFDAAGEPLGAGCDLSRDEGAALPTGVLNTTQTRQQSQGLGANLSRHDGDHRWVAGATYDRSRVRYEQYARDGRLDAGRVVRADAGAPQTFFSGVAGRAHTASLFATDTWQFAPRTVLTSALRWNRTRLDHALRNAGAAVRPRERFVYIRLDPSLGLVHRSGDWRLFADLSQSNRAPTVIELGCADPSRPCRLPTGLQADPYLKQVVARAYDLGAQWSPGPRTELTLSLYRTDNRDDILFLRAPNTQQGYFANFDRTRRQGADLAWRMHLDAFDVRIGYSYLSATYQASGTLLAGERSIAVQPGDRIAGLPRHTVKAGLDWRATPALTLGADLLAQSGTVAAGNEDGRVSDERPDLRRDWGTRGFAVIGLRASWRAGEGVELYAHVDNLFDRRYATYAAVADDILPDGRLVRPHVAPDAAVPTRFVAPGAPRLFGVGVRLDY